MNKEKFLSIAESHYSEFESLKDSPNFYDYEKNTVEFWQKVSRECMESQLNEGSVTEDRRKKKL
jgi:hypothetical protein